MMISTSVSTSYLEVGMTYFHSMLGLKYIFYCLTVAAMEYIRKDMKLQLEAIMKKKHWRVSI